MFTCSSICQQKICSGPADNGLALRNGKSVCVKLFQCFSIEVKLLSSISNYFLLVVKLFSRNQNKHSDEGPDLLLPQRALLFTTFSAGLFQLAWIFKTKSEQYLCGKYRSVTTLQCNI